MMTMASNEHLVEASSYTLHDATVNPHHHFTFDQGADSSLLGDKMAAFPDYGQVGYPSFPPLDEDFGREPISRQQVHSKYHSPSSDEDEHAPIQLQDVSAKISMKLLSSVWPASNPSPKTEYPLGLTHPPPSGQNDIVDRRDSVGHRFGQVTPPDDISQDAAIASSTKRSLPQQPNDDNAQRQRQERARNAAHSRHSRNNASQNVRRSDASGDPADDDEVDSGNGKRDKYREKNRLAAAKCRSKKKASVNDLEGRHRIMAAENNFRRREERELRDELTSLRTLALEHGPGRCSCGGLHQYNQAKAVEMAMGHRFGGPGLNVLASPLGSGPSPLMSPTSDLSETRSSEHDDVMERPVSPGSMFEQFSNTRPSNQTGQTAMLDPGRGILGSVEDFPDFADFLQSSPGALHGSA